MVSFVGAVKTNPSGNGYADHGQTFQVTKPTGLQAGDLLIVATQHTYNDGFGHLATVAPAESGWTLLVTSNQGGDSYVPNFRLWARIASAGDPATFGFTVTTNDSQGRAVGLTVAALAYRDAALPAATAASWSIVDTTAFPTFTAPAEDVADSGSLALAIFGAGYFPSGNTSSYQRTWTTPSGATERFDGQNFYPAGGGNYLTTAFAVSDRPASPTTTGTASATVSDTSQMGYDAMAATVVIAPSNAAPNAPTLTSMAAGEVIDRAASNRASHAFSDPDAGDSQSAFDHRYRLVGAATWTTAYEATPNQYVDYLAGTFAAGDHERQVRTYDAKGVVGPWSASGFFTAADAPATPTITDPINNGTISADTASVTWSAPAQDAYQLQVLDGGLVEHDTGTVASTTRTAYGVPFPDNDTTRTVRVRVRSNGLWSAWYSITVQVAYTRPQVPLVALQASGTALVVQVTNPTPGVGQPVVTHNRVLIDDDLADGETLRQDALPANGSWTYWTPRSGLDYEGRVRVVAVGDNGTEATSA